MKLDYNEHGLTLADGHVTEAEQVQGCSGHRHTDLLVTVSVHSLQRSAVVATLRTPALFLQFHSKED